MRSARFYRLTAWLSDWTRGFSAILGNPQPTLIPLRVEQPSEPELVHRQELLARYRPRQPPP